MDNKNVSSEAMDELVDELSSIIEKIKSEIETIDHSCSDIISISETLNGYNDQEIYGTRREVQLDEGNGQMSVYDKYHVWKISNCDSIISLATHTQKFLDEISAILPNIDQILLETQKSSDIIKREKALIESGLSKNISTDEYKADKGNWVGIKDENIKWWTDDELYFEKDPNQLGTNAYLVYQLDENGNKVGMGWTDEKTKNAYETVLLSINAATASSANTNKSSFDETNDYPNLHHLPSKLAALISLNLNGATNTDTNTSTLNDSMEKVLQKYSDEYQNAKYKHIDNGIYVAVNDGKVGNDSVEITHIVMNDPSSQVKIEQANGSYKNGVETASEAYDRLTSEGKKPVLIINGSNFNRNSSSEWYGTQDLESNKSTNMNHLTIANGQLVDRQSGNGDISDPSSVKAGGAEVCLSKDGTFFRATPGTSASELIDSGVQGSLSIHETPLVVTDANGVGHVSSTVDDQSESAYYERNVLGQTPDGDIYIVTGYTDKRAVAEYMLNELNCNFATSMDQGGSVASFMDGQNIYENDTENRAVGDFVVFFGND